MNRYTWQTGLLELVMIVVAIIFLFPLYVLVNLALKAPGDQSSTLAPPENATFDNFVQAWESGSLGGALINSAIVTAVTIVLIVVFASAAAYPLSRVRTRWSKIVLRVPCGPAPAAATGPAAPLPDHPGPRSAGQPGGRHHRLGGRSDAVLDLPVQRVHACPAHRLRRSGSHRRGRCVHDLLVGDLSTATADHSDSRYPQRCVDLKRLPHAAAVPVWIEPEDHHGGGLRLRRAVRRAVESDLRRHHHQHPPDPDRVLPPAAPHRSGVCGRP